MKQFSTTALALTGALALLAAPLSAPAAGAPTAGSS